MRPVANIFRGGRERPQISEGSLGHFKGGVGAKLFGSLAAPQIPGRAILTPGQTPALTGLFRRGRTVGVSQINAIATNVLRGSF